MICEYDLAARQGLVVFVGHELLLVIELVCF